MNLDHFQNPRHQFPEHIQSALNEMRAKRMEALAQMHRVAVESRPSAKERQRIQALVDEASPHKLAAARELLAMLLTSYRDRVSALEWSPYTPPLAPVESAPEPRAADFWWARTQWFAGGGINVENMTDGLHFFASIFYNRDPLFSFSAGAWATFEMQPERRPHSPSGRYSSAPGVELFGSIRGYTASTACPVHCDDKWCKCFLVLRQSAIQFVDDHGTWRVCGESFGGKTLIDEENHGVTVTAELPGWQPMPFLQFSLIRPDRSVLIDLEVRFDVQLEGHSLIFFGNGQPAGSPVLRYFQWPCVPA